MEAAQRIIVDILLTLSLWYFMGCTTDDLDA